MHVITLRQPWAWAVFHAGKDVENRTYPIRVSRVLIHAGQIADPTGVTFLKRLGITDLPEEALHGGVIIGMVTVAGAEFSTSRSVWAQKGMWHNRFTNPVPADPPIPCRGYPGLFHPPQTWERSFTKTEAAK